MSAKPRQKAARTRARNTAKRARKASAFRRKLLTDLCGRLDEPIRNCEALWHVCYADSEKNNVAVVAMSVVSRVQGDLHQLKSFAELILEHEGGAP
jgi:hypothetical protein